MEAPLRFPEHEAFLRIVHSAPGGGDELYLGRALPGAIERYVKFWLPLVSHSIGSEGRARTSHPASRYRVGVASSPARAAPIRHVLHGAIRAGPRSRDGGVPGADCLGRRRRDSAFVATAFRRRAFLPAKSATRHHTEWGARDPLSNQTTLCAEVKDKCAAVRTDLRFDYDVEACSARQRTFLWQVSRPACRDVNSATARYLRFLALMKRHGYHEHFFVPSYDIDFAWHTHMLADTTGYLRESAMLAGVSGGVDHDDSVNQRSGRRQAPRGLERDECDVGAGAGRRRRPDG